MFVIDPRKINGNWTTPFGFVGHPKCASQSVRRALLDVGARSPSGHHGVSDEDVQEILDSGGMVCSTVRNPWDLMVSWYYDRVRAYRSRAVAVTPFDRWLPKVLEGGNGWIEKGFYGTNACNRIIRFEHDIQDQLNNCLTDCGLPEVELGHMGGSAHGRYQDYYTPRTAIMVYKYFVDEIEEWGYEYEND